MRVLFAVLRCCLFIGGCGGVDPPMFKTVALPPSAPDKPPYKSPPSEPEKAKGLLVPPAPTPP
jgi:hypothetical protein